METLENYNTNAMSVAHAIAIVDLSAQSKQIGYPKDYDKLENLCNQTLKFMADNNLTKTTFHEQLSRAVGDFDTIRRLKNEGELKSQTFYKLRGILDTNGLLIAAKFQIRYSIL